MKLIRAAQASAAPIGGTATDANTSTAQPASDRRCRPPWLVAGASIATGLLASIVLTIGVFAGATEHVISGAALLAYAGGWAALAFLSGRHTHRQEQTREFSRNVFFCCE